MPRVSGYRRAKSAVAYWTIGLRRGPGTRCRSTPGATAADKIDAMIAMLDRPPARRDHPAYESDAGVLGPRAQHARDSWRHHRSGRRRPDLAGLVLASRYATETGQSTDDVAVSRLG